MMTDSDEYLKTRIEELHILLKNSQDSYYDNDLSKRLSGEEHLRLWDEMWGIHRVLNGRSQKEKTGS